MFGEEYDFDFSSDRNELIENPQGLYVGDKARHYHFDTLEDLLNLAIVKYHAKQNDFSHYYIGRSGAAKKKSNGEFINYGWQFLVAYKHSNNDIVIGFLKNKIDELEMPGEIKND